jgi:hypothetical protein
MAILATAGLVSGYTTSRTEAATVGGDPFLRTIVRQLPIRFPGYTDVLADKGYTYLYPQALAVHDGRAFLLYGAASATSNNVGTWISVVDLASGDVVSGFSLAASVYGESLVIRSQGDRTYLYARSAPGTLSRYDITSLPVARTTMRTDQSYSVGLFSHFTWDGSEFVVQQEVPTDPTAPRHVFRRFDASLSQPLGDMYFDRNDFPPLAASLIPTNLKAQSVVSWQDGYVVGYGALHVYGDVENPSRLQGIRVLDGKGARTAEGLMHPDMFIDALRSAGLQVNHIENEGLAASGGQLFGLWVTSSHRNTAPFGVVITRELQGPVDCHACVATFDGPGSPTGPGDDTNSPDLAALTPPTLSGRPVVGRATRVAPVEWSATPAAVTYRWLVEGTEVPGADGDSFRPRRPDAGKRVRAVLTASSADGRRVVVSTPPARVRVRTSTDVTVKLGPGGGGVIARVHVSALVPRFVKGEIRLSVDGRRVLTKDVDDTTAWPVSTRLTGLREGRHEVRATFSGTGAALSSRSAVVRFGNA